MSNWISFPNYPPMEMLLRPCSSLDQSVPFSLDRWFPLDLTSEAPADGQDSPSSMTIGGGGEVLPAVGGAVSSDSTEVTVSGANGKSSESLTVADGSVNGNAKALTAVTSPVKAFGHRSSIYRGVTKHRWTGRYEAHLWDNTCKIEGQKRKGRQERCRRLGMDG